MKYKLGDIREVAWDDVRLEIKKLAPDIFDAIEQFSPNKSYKLYEAVYPYGFSIVDDSGHFNLPINGQSVSVDSPKIPDSLKEQLKYTYFSVPLGIVLKGQVQLSFLGKNNLLCPANIFNPGNVLAKYATLDLPDRYQLIGYWRMTAGARTAYMLGGLADHVHFTRLRSVFNADLELPKRQSDHWSFFRDVANSPKFKTNWQCRILFFGKKWVTTLNKNDQLKLALFNQAWKATALQRYDYVFDQIWDDFVDTIRNKKVDRYVLNMARHLLEVSIGKGFSFQVADAQDKAGPFSEVAEIICDEYKLKKYAPVIMVPAFYNPDIHSAAYVSIQLPTVKFTRKYVSKNNFLMADFREIYWVINKFPTFLKTKIPGIVPTHLDSIRKINYQFYSGDKDRMGKFLDAKTLFKNDKHIKHWLSFGEKNINVKNTFMRACVRISPKSEK